MHTYALDIVFVSLCRSEFTIQMRGASVKTFNGKLCVTNWCMEKTHQNKPK